MTPNNLPIQIKYSQRKTIALELRADGILIKAPRQMSRRDIEAFIASKQDWIHRHYQMILERQEQLSHVQKFTIDELEELGDKAVIEIPKRVRYYASIIGVPYGRITIRNQRTRWGSCSSKGNLNFNCLLMLFPDEVIDYVVVHELCHRKHMNHSAEFYAEVERILPDYRTSRKWLKDNGSVYLSRLP